jgi:mannose/cellobiose epimerase-like protein (N-acyl-D-glucosamine 2-epimerase family)
VNLRRLAADGMIMIATIALRLTPLEQDLLAASLAVLLHRFWPQGSDDDEKRRDRFSKRNPFHCTQRANPVVHACEGEAVGGAE